MDQQFGLSRATYQNYASFNKPVDENGSKSTTVLTLKHLQTAFIVLLVGAIASFVIFLLEIVFFKTTAKRQRIE